MTTKELVDIKHNTNEYRNIHQWIRYHFGKATKCTNVNCDGQSKRYDWALIKGKQYERDINNYLELCRKCHIRYDFTEERIDNIKKRCVGGVMSREKYESMVWSKARGTKRTDEQKLNMALAARKRSKLKVEDILFIRGSNLMKTELAKMFKVTPENIGAIIHRKSWNNI